LTLLESFSISFWITSPKTPPPEKRLKSVRTSPTLSTATETAASAISIGLSQFEKKFNQGRPIIRDRAGCWKNTPEGRLFLFTASGLREAADNFEKRRVLQTLKTCDALTKTGGNEKATPERTPDGRVVKLYWIDPEAL
jgi:hypothetical protein